ncbi:MAG TPA: hypothetical protein PKD12_02240 [Nitrospira sp.]|nr:hypothetical protein [Nitrospira sp.]
MERVASTIKGLYRDRLYGADGRLLQDRGWQHNTILDGCRMLLAGFMMNETASGIALLAVGQGHPSWDVDGVPAASPSATTGLLNRFNPPIPFTDLDVVYLDGIDQVVAERSMRLQITATLAPGYPAPVMSATSYPLREFGLFANLNGQEVMINTIRHPVLHKDEASTLIRVIRLYF